MSSISMSASGARSLSTTVNDPARTSASIPTKTGDCISVSTGSLGECRLSLPPSARIERRITKGTTSVRQQDGTFKDEPVERESWQLVIPNGLGAMFLRANSDTAWPHLSVDVRKPEDGSTPFMEQGEVVETHTLVDLGLATVDESGAYGPAYEWKSEGE